MSTTSVLLAADHQPLLTGDTIRPYFRFLVLQDLTPSMPPLTVPEFFSAVQRTWRTRKSFSLLEHATWPGVLDAGVQWSGGLVQQVGQPAWCAASGVDDVEHSLIVIGRIGRYTLVNADSAMCDAYRKALGTVAQGRYQTIPPSVLFNALGGGDIRNLFMSGVHRPSVTKPGAKTLSGLRLQDALTSADGTFVTTASKLDASAIFGAKAEIGLALFRSSIWKGPTASFADYEQLATTVVGRIDGAQGAPSVHHIPFAPQAVASLNEVSGAFALSTLLPGELADDEHDAIVRAVETLSEAEFTIRPATAPERFHIEATMGGVMALTAVGGIRQEGDEVKFSFGEVTLNHPELGLQVSEALRHDDLFTVHFASGHTWLGRQVYTVEIPDVRFDNWRWADFDGVAIRREKPGTPYSADLIATPTDDSLFGWVVRQFGGRAQKSRSGAQRPFEDVVITCDDGAGEVADFVALDITDGEKPRVTLFHVKAAKSDHPGRGMAAGPLEQVVAQAQKNLVYGTVGQVRRALAAKPDAATWIDGVRTTDGRRLMLDLLDDLDAGATVDVAIVQPHLREEAYDRALLAGETTAARLRVRQAEALLNELKGAVAARAGSLYVYGVASS